MGTHKMAQIHGPKQGVVILHDMIQVLTGRVDPCQVLGVHEAQDMAHDLKW